MNAHVHPRDVADESLPFQNPLYPQDAGLTDDEFNAKARATSLMRAQSPGLLVCQIDETTSIDDPTHADDFATCMAFREANVIGDQEPWTYWELFDVWAAAQPPIVPVPEPVPLAGWYPVARINPAGISQMDNFGAAAGVTFATVIAPAAFIMTAGSQVRLRLSGNFTFSDCVIGPAGGNSNPWVAQALYPLTFGGQNQATIPPGMNSANYFDPYGELVSDPLPQSMDFTQGVHVAFYCVSGNITRRLVEPGWTTSNNSGNVSNVLDKSAWGVESGVADISVLMIESLYP